MKPVTIRVPDAPLLGDTGATQLLAMLDRDGEEARVIGGAVRNLLLGVPPGDLDIATTALPAEVAARAKARGFKVVPTGIEHGTVTVIIAGKPFEVTTLRQDVETFGRKAMVRFGRDWKADAERRDFTMNALSMTRHGDVIDWVGGIPDLEARRVRFIGDANQRIREDYLRILRFYRFHAHYGIGAPDPAGVAATIAQREGIASLSLERIRAELLKLLAGHGAAATVAQMSDAGLLLANLGVTNPPQLARMAALESALGLSPDAVRRLGALAVHIPDDADRLGVRLRLSSNEQQRLSAMAKGWHGIADELTEHAAKTLLYRTTGHEDEFLDRVLFAWTRAVASPGDSAWQSFASLPKHWQAPRFSLRAADLIARGLAKGPSLGAALAAAEADWIAAGFPDDAKAIAALADRHARF